MFTWGGAEAQFPCSPLQCSHGQQLDADTDVMGGRKGSQKRDPLNPTWASVKQGEKQVPQPPQPSPHTYHKRAQGAPCVPGEEAAPGQRMLFISDTHTREALNLPA